MCELPHIVCFMKKQTTPKKPASRDWHPADIKAALEKAGWSLRRLSVHTGMAPTSVQKCLYQPWPRAERAVAQAIGLPPRQIWPSRYNRDGSCKRGRRGNYSNSDVDSRVEPQRFVA